MQKTIKCAMSYSHNDKKLCERFLKHIDVFKRTYPLEIWCDMEIMAGEDIDIAIKSKFNECDIIFLMVSNDYVASKFCYEIEMKNAVNRHNKNECIVIPVILSKVVIIDDLPFAKLKRIPEDGKPIKDFPSQEKGLENADSHIKNLLSKFVQERNIFGTNDEKMPVINTGEKTLRHGKSTITRGGRNNANTIKYKVVKEGKLKKVKISQSLVDDLPDFLSNTIKFSKELQSILDNSLNSYKKDFSNMPKVKVSASNKWRLKYFRTFLFEITNAVQNNYIGNINTRVHMRRLVDGKYEGLVLSGNCDSVQKASNLTVMPSREGMIFVSANLSYPLIRSLNKSIYVEGKTKSWVEHLTCTFRDKDANQTPLLSMGISLDEKTVKKHKNVLLLMSYMRIDLIIEDVIKEYLSGCKEIDAKHELSEFIVAKF